MIESKVQNKKLNGSAILDNIGLFLIGFFSLGYLLFVRRFAELHIQFPFLNFPIFVGEILLFLCLILLFIKWRISFPKFNICCYLLFSYFGFVLVKAFWGYFKWGPLAFRHAALFYYPLFAIFGYTFYRRSFFGNKKNLFLALLIIFIFKFIPFYCYFVLTCFILAFILIKAQSHKIVRYSLFSLLLIVTPYKQFFDTSRTFLVSNVASGIYIIIALFFVLKVKKSYRLILSLLLVSFIAVGVLKIADKNAVESITTFRKLRNLYNEHNESIVEKKNSFKMKELKEVKLYNPEATPFEEIQSKIEKAQTEIREAQSKVEEIQLAPKKPQSQIEKAQTEIREAQSKVEEIQLLIGAPRPSIRKAELQIKKLQSQIMEVQVSIKEAKSQIEKAQPLVEAQAQDKIQQKPSLRSLEGLYNNALFRIFIWRDMLTELKQRRPFLGFDFGKPLRSISLEIRDWASSEWKRDGWITAHNSHLHIIYRAGIIGILFILTIFVILFRMIKKSLQFGSSTGVLLCGILINWLVAANFLVILELPYDAIPFWSLFGMTFAYVNNLQMKKRDENTNNP